MSSNTSSNTSVSRVVAAPNNHNTTDVSLISTGENQPLKDCPIFEILEDKDTARFTPHPQANQCFKLFRNLDKTSWVWEWSHEVKSFNTYRVNVKNFRKFNPKKNTK